MPADHAKFSPSSMARVIKCPKSWGLNNAAAELGPGVSSDAAREGTIAHALGEFCLVNHVTPTSLVGKKLTVEIDGEDVQHVVDKDMAEHVTVYTDHCETLSMLSDRRYVEETVHITLSVMGEDRNDLLWGTADFTSITDGERIDVVDLKYGGLPVEPEDNPQLIAYLLGALELVPDQEIKTAGIHIVQPRVSKEPKIWEIDDVPALVTKWKTIFRDAVMRAKEAALVSKPLDAHYSAGEHCRFCAAIATCPHFAKHMIDMTAEELESIENTKETYHDGELAKLVSRFKARKIVAHYYDRLEDHLKAAIRKGKRVPDLKIVRALGNRKWNLNDPEMMAKLRTQGLKKKDFCIEKVKSPAQIEKILENPRFFERHVTRSDNGEKLVPLSDKRPAIDICSELQEINVELPAVKREKPTPPAPVDLDFDLDLDLDLEF